MTYEKIIEQLRKLANGDIDTGNPKNLAASLEHLAFELKRLSA